MHFGALSPALKIDVGAGLLCVCSARQDDVCPRGSLVAMVTLNRQPCSLILGSCLTRYTMFTFGRCLPQQHKQTCTHAAAAIICKTTHLIDDKGVLRDGVLCIVICPKQVHKLGWWSSG